jgi:hypothetical protein
MLTSVQLEPAESPEGLVSALEAICDNPTTVDPLGGVEARSNTFHPRTNSERSKAAVTEDLPRPLLAGVADTPDVYRPWRQPGSRRRPGHRSSSQRVRQVRRVRLGDPGQHGPPGRRRDVMPGSRTDTPTGTTAAMPGRARWGSPALLRDSPSCGAPDLLLCRVWGDSRDGADHSPVGRSARKTTPW